MAPFAVDNLTLVLLGCIAALLLYHRFFSTPTPLLHPLFLGKQSDVSSVRKEGESGIYRNWATGQGAPFTVRPANTLKTVNDIVPTSVGAAGAVPRCILDVSLSDESLAELIRMLPLGLNALFSLPTSAMFPAPILTLLPPSPSTALPLLLLQLACSPATPLAILPHPTLLTAALVPQGRPPHSASGLLVVHESLLTDVIEQVYEDKGDKVGVLVVGDPQRSCAGIVETARSRRMNIHWWEEVWDAAESSDSTSSVPPAHFNDVHSYFYSEVEGSDVPQIVKVTHLNITAGIAGLLAVFPPDKRPSNKTRDVVASSVRLDTPLGMCIALASVWSGAGFRFIGPPEPTWSTEFPRAMESELQRLCQEKPSPTLLFISPAHLDTMVKHLKAAFANHPLANFAASHKLNAIQGGDMSRSGISEKAVWKPIRENVLGGLTSDKLRGVVCVGDAIPSSTLTAGHALLSLPIARIFPSTFSTGPVFASHFHDVQSAGIHKNALTSSHHPVSGGDEVEMSHTGPPASNIEILLKGPNAFRADDAASTPEYVQEPNLSGEVYIRGPTVLSQPGVEVSEGWVDTRVQAEVQTNGTFIIQPPVPAKS